MKPLLLTKTDGTKQMVNMDLVSEAIPVSTNNGIYTNLVVPSAAYEDARFVAVKETPEQIARMINESPRV
jgi:hypothetical protein